MASRTTATITRIAKQAAPSSQSLALPGPLSVCLPTNIFVGLTRHLLAASRLAARQFSSSPSTLFTPTPSPRDSAPTGSRLYSPSAPALQAHLSEVLSPLGCELKPETAERAMTSKGLASTGGSVKENGGKTAHSEKLVFLGKYTSTRS